MPDEKKVSAGGVVFENADKTHVYLILPSNNYGPWSFPKGRVDQGETLEAAAIREVGEETGLKVKIEPGGYIGVGEGGYTMTHYFNMIRTGGSPKGDWETEEVKLFTVADALAKLKSVGNERDFAILTQAKTAATAQRPYGHIAYQRTSKTGKVSYVSSKGGKVKKEPLNKSGEGSKKKSKKTSPKKGIATGPGSRGGRIIGYTGAGRAVYENGGAANYPHFYRHDHKDASELHMNLANKEDPGSEKWAHHYNRAMDHHYAPGKPLPTHADLHAKLHSKPKLKKSGEGSHGGHILGHTKSGKPIYGLSHALASHFSGRMREHADMDRGALVSEHVKAHKDFDVHDHVDAAMLHRQMEAKQASGKGRHTEAHHHLSAEYAKAAKEKGWQTPSWWYKQPGVKKSMLEKAGFTGNQGAPMRIPRSNRSSVSRMSPAYIPKAKKPRRLRPLPSFKSQIMTVDELLMELRKGNKMDLSFLSKASKTGPGSRGGKISRYSKTGKAVYAAYDHKMATQLSQQAYNHGDHAFGHEGHARAARAHLAAAFYSHHGGSKRAAREHMEEAHHHHKKASGALAAGNLHSVSSGAEPVRSSSDHKWNDKHVHATHELIHGKATEENKKTQVEMQPFQPTFKSEMFDDIEAMLKSGFGAPSVAAPVNRKTARSSIGTSSTRGTPAATPTVNPYLHHASIAAYHSSEAKNHPVGSPQHAFHTQVSTHHEIQATRSTMRKGERMDFAKGGEGSRGGRIVGHTRSRKPIYEHKSGSVKSHVASHTHFNEHDHMDAARHHYERSADLLFGREADRNNTSPATYEAAKKHKELGAEHAKAGLAKHKGPREEKTSEKPQGSKGSRDHFKQMAEHRNMMQTKKSEGDETMKSEVTDFNDIFKSDSEQEESTKMLEVQIGEGDDTYVIEVPFREIAKSLHALKKGKNRRAKGAIALGNEENVPTIGPGKKLGFMKLDRKGKKGKDLPPVAISLKGGKNTRKAMDEDDTDLKKDCGTIHAKLSKGEKCSKCDYMKKADNVTPFPVAQWVVDDGPTGDEAIAKAIMAANGLGQGDLPSARNPEMEVKQ